MYLYFSFLGQRARHTHFGLRGVLQCTRSWKAKLQKILQISSHETAGREDKVLQRRGKWKICNNIFISSLKNFLIKMIFSFIVWGRISGGPGSECDLGTLVPWKGCPRAISYVSYGILEQCRYEQERGSRIWENQLSPTARFQAIPIQPHA